MPRLPAQEGRSPAPTASSDCGTHEQYHRGRPADPDERVGWPTVLTPEEVGALLRVAVKTLANWRVRGFGPEFVKVGRRIRYPLSSICRWLEDHQARSTTHEGPERCPAQIKTRSVSE